MTDCVMPHDGAERALDALLVCPRHRRLMDNYVREVGLLIVDTQFIRDGGAPTEQSAGGGKMKKRADPPAPGDVTIMALYDPRSGGVDDLPSVTAVVASWVLWLADERPLKAQLPASVLAQLDLLRRHHEWIAAQPSVDDYLMELGELRKALAAAVRDHPYERRGYCRLPVDDRVCGGTLIEENGTRRVRCTGCGAQWITDQELARLAVSLETR